MKILNREIKIIFENAIAGWELLIIVLTRYYSVLCSNLSIKKSQHKSESLTGSDYRVKEMLLYYYLKS